MYLGVPLFTLMFLSIVFFIGYKVFRARQKRLIKKGKENLADDEDFVAAINDES
jgi:hypothetical protein